MHIAQVPNVEVRCTDIPVVKDEWLHARPFQELVERARTFHAAVTVSRGSKSGDAKEILDMLLLAGEHGPLHLHAEGADAGQAVEALATVLCEALDRERKKEEEEAQAKRG